MCRWCDDQTSYYTSTSAGPLLVTSCPFCNRNLPKAGSSKNFLEVPVDQTSSMVLPDINLGRNTKGVVGKMKDCNLSKSLPGLSSSASSLRDHSPSKLPPISGFGASKTSPTQSHRNASPYLSLPPPPPPPPPPSHPTRNSTFSSLNCLKEEVKIARETDDWKIVEEFFTNVHSTMTTLSGTFKTDNHEIDLKKIYYVYDVMWYQTPESIHKATLKSMISCLLTQQLPQTQELVEALFIALLNPMFCDISTYLVFAHIMKRISLLHNQYLYQFVCWFTKLSEEHFRKLLTRIQDFIACRLFPPSENQLPPIHRATWWVPSAIKILSLLRAANDISLPKLVSYADFYVNSIDHLNLLSDYNDWQNSTSQSKFSFCQYPFVISINAKRKILQQDSEQQMISVARNVLLAEVTSRAEPNIEMLFLNVNVRRSHLVSDSLRELSTKRKELKKKLKVSFIGEPGLDMGGLKKEWFLLLTREIFQPQYGMFKMDEHSLMYWFCKNPTKGLQEYSLVGKLMGLAVYNGINLDVRFPTICYRKLLSPAIVPYRDPSAPVGLVKVSMDDVIESMPIVGKGLKDLLEYDGDVEEDFCLSFQINFSDGSGVVTADLKDNGDQIPVTNANRREYVGLYKDFLFNKNIYHQFQAFYLGFHSVCASNALIMLQPEEVELLVCGNPVLDMSVLKTVASYDGYTNQDETIKHFWEVVLEEFTGEEQKQFLSFTTGSDRLPAGGANEMEFKISRYDDSHSLPMSHTCFNQLILPNYKDKVILKAKLTKAIQNTEGFGLK